MGWLIAHRRTDGMAHDLEQKRWFRDRVARLTANKHPQQGLAQVRHAMTSLFQSGQLAQSLTYGPLVGVPHLRQARQPFGVGLPTFDLQFRSFQLPAVTAVRELFL